MKYLLICLCLSLFSITANAQSKDHKAVTEAVEKLRKAMIDGDQASLEAITSDSLSYGHSGGKVENKAEFIAAFVSGKSDFVTIDLSDQTVSVFQNFAVVRHGLYATNIDGGKPGTVKLKLLLVFAKEKGQWKLLARQAVKLPL